MGSDAGGVELLCFHLDRYCFADFALLWFFGCYNGYEIYSLNEITLPFKKKRKGIVPTT